jgi:hypothetical protein
MNIPKNGCNYIEIYIGQLKNNLFCCDITQNQFDIWKKKCAALKTKPAITQRLYYKNIIMETMNGNRYYKQKLISYNTKDNKLFQYYINSPCKQSEFPCKKKYTHDEQHKTIQFCVDKNINIFFNYSPYHNIKITSSNTEKVNLPKLHNIIQLFT